MAEQLRIAKAPLFPLAISKAIPVRHNVPDAQLQGLDLAHSFDRWE